MQNSQNKKSLQIILIVLIAVLTLGIGYASAKAEFGHPAAIAHEVENGLVKVSYMTFERNGHIYSLKGTISEYGANKPVYDANVLVLKEAFGPNWQSICSEGGGGYYFKCSVNGFYAFVENAGNIKVEGSDWYCYISSAGGTRCKEQ